MNRDRTLAYSGAAIAAVILAGSVFFALRANSPARSLASDARQVIEHSGPARVVEMTLGAAGTESRFLDRLIGGEQALPPVRGHIKLHLDEVPPSAAPVKIFATVSQGHRSRFEDEKPRAILRPSSKTLVVSSLVERQKVLTDNADLFEFEQHIYLTFDDFEQARKTAAHVSPDLLSAEVEGQVIRLRMPKITDPELERLFLILPYATLRDAKGGPVAFYYEDDFDNSESGDTTVYSLKLLRSLPSRDKVRNTDNLTLELGIMLEHDGIIPTGTSKEIRLRQWSFSGNLRDGWKGN
ncbi:MAG: hypothetical protein NDJ90_10865 [Oligoflexia bacterium]|nr:hypothetical protein [Oligoflexia bacterium]